MVGIPGLNIQILHYIAVNGYNGPKDLARGIGLSPTSVRERYQAVLGSGFIYEVEQKSKSSVSGRASGYASLKGRVFLSLLREVLRAYEAGEISHELQFILARLRIEPRVDIAIPDLDGPDALPFVNAPASPSRTCALLIATARTARKRGVSLLKDVYRLDPVEGQNEYDLTR